MNEITAWNYDGSKVRTVQKDNEPWWVLRDVCSVLDMNTNRAGEVVKRLDEDEYDLIGVTDSLGRTQNTYIINESGLYSVILRSDKSQAKPFRKWVTSEVLPAIRKTGSYTENLSPILRWMIEAEQKMNSQQAQINAVGEKIDAIQSAFTLELDDWRNDVRSLVSKISIAEYGDFSGIENTYQTAYNLLENRADVNLSARVRNKQKRLMLNGVTKKTIMAVSMLDVINDDKKLKEIFTAILREMLAGGVING